MKINYELLCDLAKKQNIPVHKAKHGENPGIYISDGNGGKKEFTIKDLNGVIEEKILLVKFKTNWADEIDFEEYAIMNEKDYYEMLKYIKYLAIKEYNEFNIGTNEEIELREEDFSKQILTKEEERILRNTILKNNGTTLNFPKDYILDDSFEKKAWEIIYTIYYNNSEEKDFEDNGIGEDKKGKYYICQHCGEKIYDIYDSQEYYGNYCPICKIRLIDVD